MAPPGATTDGGAAETYPLNTVHNGLPSMENGELMADPPLVESQPEYIKTLCAFLLLVLGAFLNFFLLTVIHDIVPMSPLPDLAFMLIPQQHWAWPAADILSFISSTLAFLLIFFHRHRWVVVRRTFLIGGILYSLRAICLGVTFLPSSFENRQLVCLPQQNRTAVRPIDIFQRFLHYIVTFGLTSGQGKILCGDLMFSGHTIVFALSYFVLVHYTPPRAALLRWLMTPVCYVGLVFVVISGGHYSIDVLVAYWLTSHLFWSYHQVFESHKQDRHGCALSNLWWYWVCYWFEDAVPEGVLENELSWPFARPKAFCKAFERLSRYLNQ